MMIKRIGALVFLVGVAFFTTAQTGPIKFEEDIYKFGTINEENGPITHEFKFLNTGGQAIKINSVKASCGCTTPAWTKNEIKPGQAGFITAQYNPNNRPGPFKKSLTVKSNVGSKVLYIEGFVKPKPKTPADDYPNLVGNLRSKSKTFNFGKVTTQKSITKSFELFNDGENPISFLDTYKFPDYLEVNFVPGTLAPKEKGVMKITFDPNKKNKLGYVIDNVLLATDDVLEPEKNFTIMATVQEYFEPLTNVEYANAPQILFDESVNDLGDIAQGEIATTEFAVANVGKQTLNLRRISTNCSCLTTTVEKYDLAPGDSTRIKVAFNTANRGGTQHKSITVYSNDPRQSIMLLTVKSSVKVRR